MFSMKIVLLGVALAIDAAVVTFAIGLLHHEETPAKKFTRGVVVSGLFGVFQALMLWLGSYTGYLFTFSSVGFYFQFGVGIIFFGLALKFFLEGVSLEKKKLEWGVLPLIILAFATSIDAFASGISLGTIPQAYKAAIEVGLITSIICGGFYSLSHYFHKIPDRWLLFLAGMIFIFLSGQVFWAYRYFIFRG